MRGYNDGYDDCPGGGGSGDSGGSSGSLDDIRDLCMDTLDWSADRCLINTGKTFIICRAINAIGVPVHARYTVPRGSRRSQFRFTTE